MTLIAHWKCDENQGKNVTSVADSSGHPNNHDFTSVGYSSSSVGFVNKSRHSNAASGDRHISVNNNADLSLIGNMTIMAWIMPQGVPTNTKYLVGFGAGGAGNVQADNLLWSLIWSTTGQFGMQWEQGAGVDVNALSTSTPVVPKADYPLHLAVVRTINGANRDVKFYLDGSDLSEDVTGLTAPDGGGNSVCEMLRIPGADSNVPKANIWGVRVYDTAESAGAISTIHSAERSEADRFGYPTDGIVPLQLLAEGAYQPQTLGIEQSQPGGPVYEGVPTGTNLDPVERPNSGWATEGP
jgi:hypothetical protein